MIHGRVALALSCAIAGLSSFACAQTACAQTPAASQTEPSWESRAQAPRAYGVLRFGRLGSASLHTSEAELDGTPNHVYALGARFELPLLRYLTSGLEFDIGGVSGADLHQLEAESIEFTPIDAGVLIGPRLPLLGGRVEARVQLLAGITSMLFLEGEFPVRGQGALESYAFAESPGFGVYVGGGLGATVWLDRRFSAFVELDLLQRHGSATVKPGSSTFDAGMALPESRIELDETHGVIVFGFGYSAGGR